METIVKSTYLFLRSIFFQGELLEQFHKVSSAGMSGMLFTGIIEPDKIHLLGND